MVAEQCRRHLRQYKSGPFDWLVTPFDALPRVFWTKGRRLGESFVCADGGKTVRCKKYGLMYQHEFARDDYGMVTFDADQVAECRGRLLHKMGNLNAALTRGERILFIRAFSSTGTADDRLTNGTFNAADLNELVQAIEISAPDCDFDVLFVHSGERTDEKTDLNGPLSDRVIVREIPHPPGMPWFGHDDDWRQMFRELDLSPMSTGPASGESDIGTRWCQGNF